MVQNKLYGTVRIEKDDSDEHKFSVPENQQVHEEQLILVDSNIIENKASVL